MATQHHQLPAHDQCRELRKPARGTHEINDVCCRIAASSLSIVARLVWPATRRGPSPCHCSGRPSGPLADKASMPRPGSAARRSRSPCDGGGLPVATGIGSRCWSVADANLDASQAAPLQEKGRDRREHDQLLEGGLDRGQEQVAAVASVQLVDRTRDRRNAESARHEQGSTRRQQRGTGMPCGSMAFDIRREEPDEALPRLAQPKIVDRPARSPGVQAPSTPL